MNDCPSRLGDKPFSAEGFHVFALCTVCYAAVAAVPAGGVLTFVQGGGVLIPAHPIFDPVAFREAVR